MPGNPPGSSWGLWGPDDALGTLNFQTPERRAAAAQLARRGAVFNLDLPLHLPARPFFGSRRRPTHTIVRWPNGSVQDDYLDGFYPQYSSQWDGLRHIRHPQYGYYNATSDDDAGAGGSKLGIEHFARHGIVGRGVLLDVERFFGRQGETLKPDELRQITADQLDEVAEDQGVELQPGDVIMLRTGMARWLLQEAEAGPQEEQRQGYAGPGLDQGDESLAWLWNHQVSAIVSDNLAVEATPFRPNSKTLHHYAIAMLGLVLGELFDLEGLAADCAADGVYECLFVAKPLLLHGGIGSSANALAMK